MFKDKSNNEKNKQVNTIVKALLPALLLFLSFPFILSMTASYNALIKMHDGKFYNGKNIIINGNILIGRISDNNFTTRRNALSARTIDKALSWQYLRMEEISFIEIETKEKEEDRKDLTASRFLGAYRINAEGNMGYLYLREKNGRLYGTIRFPNYANGVYEGIKNLKISKNRISFTRSATTSKELKRIGVSSFFKQDYSGWFNKKGNYIQGQYVIPGSIRNWKAYKIKK